MPASVYSLYIDDSGTRHPDHNPLALNEVNWFGLGGILLKESDEEAVRAAHANFYLKWPDLKTEPLHSFKIRMATGPFSFLAGKQVRTQFMSDLTECLMSVPVYGHACVIHRPGYMNRYAERYGEKRWELCKTALSVLLERAVKFVTRAGPAKLRVYVEETDKTVDDRVRAYYKELRTEGLPFESDTSAKYTPLSQQAFKETLYDLKFKKKSSPLMQFADLYLYPICNAPYRVNRAYDTIKAHERLIDCVYAASQLDTLGVKYSCFDDGPSVRSRLNGERPAVEKFFDRNSPALEQKLRDIPSSSPLFGPALQTLARLGVVETASVEGKRRKQTGTELAGLLDVLEEARGQDITRVEMFRIAEAALRAKRR